MSRSFNPLLSCINAVNYYVFIVALYTGPGASAVAGLTPLPFWYPSRPPSPMEVWLGLTPDKDFFFWSFIFSTLILILFDGFLPVPRFLVVTSYVIYTNIMLKLFRRCYIITVCKFLCTFILMGNSSQHGFIYHYFSEAMHVLHFRPFVGASQELWFSTLILVGWYMVSEHQLRFHLDRDVRFMVSIMLAHFNFYNGA